MEILGINVHPYLGPENIEKLKKAHIETVSDFLNCDTKQIEKLTALTLKEILEIKKGFLKTYSHPRSAFDYYQSILSSFAIIPTGIQSLDNLLEGGIFTGNIYEICGLPAAGKTVFCLTLLKNLAAKHTNEIFYLDTKNDFSGLKMKEIMSSLKKEELIKAMNRILVIRINTKQDFLKALLGLKDDVQNGKIVKFIFIDSLAPPSFSSTHQTENNAFLNYSANILQYLAKEHNVTIIITNLITLWNDGDFKNKDVMKESISCGKYWYSVPNVRIVLKKDQETCRMTLTKTIKFIPEIDFCIATITDKGFV